MNTLKLASWTYAEDFIPEADVIEQARARGVAFGAAAPVGTGAGATLRVLASATGARHVVEVGTGAGTSGLWLLAGMPTDGVLTTIDISPEHQKAAKEAYAAAGHLPQRTRVISGRAADVLPRMTDDAYDMVVIDADKPSYPTYVEHGIRLLRRGGLLVLDNMLWDGKVADPAVRDETTTILRNLGKSLRDDDSLVSSLLPVSDGLFVAVKK